MNNQYIGAYLRDIEFILKGIHSELEKIRASMEKRLKELRPNKKKEE